MTIVQRHEDLIVFKKSIDVAVDVFHACRQFPRDEKYRLADQWLRSSRSVCGNIAEAWRKRHYPAHFLSKLSDSEAEARKVKPGHYSQNVMGLLSEQSHKTLRSNTTRFYQCSLPWLDNPINGYRVAGK